MNRYIKNGVLLTKPNHPRMIASSPEMLLSYYERAHIRAHYQRAMPYLERHFGGTPVIAVTFPGGFGGDAVYHHTSTNVPTTIGTVPVRHNVTWLCAAHGAVELHGLRPRGESCDPPRGTATAPKRIVHAGVRSYA